MNERKNNIIVLIAVVVLIAVFLVSLTIGKFPITLEAVLEKGSVSRNIFFTLRLPRVLMGLLAGFALSSAGSAFQLLFKNPLASPDIIGVSSGASIGTCFSIFFFGGGMIMTMMLSFISGIITVMIVMLMASKSTREQMSTIILCGIAINAVAKSIVMFFKFISDPDKQLVSIEYWLMGTFSSVKFSKLMPAFFAIVIGTIGIYLLHRQIVILSLGSDEASMLGVKVKTIRRLILMFATISVAGVVSVTGLITFIGLIAPHSARMLLKNNSLKTMFLGGVLGAIILLISDCLARTLAGSEIPVSIITSLFGTPFMIYLIYKGGNEL